MTSVEKRIAEERKQLIEYFNNTSDMLALKLIDHASFMRITLQDLEKYINENGVKEPWSNGTNQNGLRECTEVKTYRDMIKNYTAIIKQLNDMAGSNKSNNHLEDFKKF